MATFDQLSPQQRAIIELVLQQGKTYEELSGMLDMSENRVRELARDALVDLTPVTAQRVEDDWRGQLADYVLGQQSGPESTATRGHLRRSEAARAWARSLLDSLDNLYGDGLPSIPDGERGGRLRREVARASPEPEPAKPSDGARGLSADARAAVKRRRLVAAGGALALLALVAILLWPIGLLTGDDGGGGGGQTAARQPASSSRPPAGIAVIAQQGGRRQVVVQAANLPATTSGRREAYEVWLYNSPGDAKSLGAQVTDRSGRYQGAGPLPADYARYRFVDVSREPIDQNRGHSGQSVLRGRLGKLRTPPKNAKPNQAVVLGQVILTPPR
jgi:sigma-70-like protein/anti-sigma-K factor RskA